MTITQYFQLDPSSAPIWLVAQGMPGSAASPRTALQSSWTWPLWWLLLLLAVCVSVVVICYSCEQLDRRVRLLLVGLRILLVLLIIFMLFGFGWQSYRTDESEIVVLLDDTQSMSTVDDMRDVERRPAFASRLSGNGFDRASRINQAKTILLDQNEPLLNSLYAQHRLRVEFVGNGRPEPSDAEDDLATYAAAIRDRGANHADSPIGDRLARIITSHRGASTSAVVLITDGIVTSGEPIFEAASLARAQGVPLTIVGLGDPTRPTEIRFTNVLMNDVVFVGETVRCDVSLLANGFTDNAVSVELRDVASREIVTREIIQVPPGQQRISTSLQFRTTRVGVFDFVVQARLADEDQDAIARSRTLRFAVRDDTVRVLFVQAYPSREYHFLKRLLSRAMKASDKPPFELATVLQDADLRYVETDSTAKHGFPLSDDELLEYDVLVFGDVDPARLPQTAMENIINFVIEDGRGVVFISGSEYTPLSYHDTPLQRLFPAELHDVSVPGETTVLSDSFAVRPTRLGSATSLMQLGDNVQENDRVWDELKELYWSISIEKLKPGVLVLASRVDGTNEPNHESPLICMRNIGGGIVMFHATDETWRWHRSLGESPHGRYWTQVIRFLARAKLATGRAPRLVSSRSEYEVGQDVNLRFVIYDSNNWNDSNSEMVVSLTDDEEGTRSIRLKQRVGYFGMFEGVVSRLRPGKYRATVESPKMAETVQTEFVVNARPHELSRLTADFDSLRRAARQTGGKFYEFHTAARLPDELSVREPAAVVAAPFQPIWNTWPIATAFVLLLTTEWLVRKRVGLL